MHRCKDKKIVKNTTNNLNALSSARALISFGYPAEKPHQKIIPLPFFSLDSLWRSSFFSLYFLFQASSSLFFEVPLETKGRTPINIGDESIFPAL